MNIKKLLGTALLGLVGLATVAGLSGTALAHEPCDDEVTVVQPVYDQVYEQAYTPVQVYDRRDEWRDRERLRRFERMRQLRAEEWRYRHHRFGRFGRF